MMMDQFNIIQKIAIWALPLIFAITVHEVAHGWVANKLGDPTAKRLGRITLNPIKHIDPIGTIAMPLILLILSGFTFAFGFAKPVPVTWQNLKNPKRDMVLVALAGPFVNLLMAVAWGLTAKLAQDMSDNRWIAGKLLVAMGMIGILVNLLLMILNLIPIPPLDGSRVISAALPNKAAYYYSRIEPYGIIVLILLLVTGMLGKVLMPMTMTAFKFTVGLLGL